jgi:hypothetical protein
MCTVNKCTEDMKTSSTNTYIHGVHVTHRHTDTQTHTHGVHVNTCTHTELQVHLCDDRTQEQSAHKQLCCFMFCTVTVSLIDWGPLHQYAHTLCKTTMASQLCNCVENEADERLWALSWRFAWILRVSATRVCTHQLHTYLWRRSSTPTYMDKGRFQLSIKTLSNHSSTHKLS